MASPVSDGGFKSRKWVGFLITCIMIVVAGKTMSEAALSSVVIGITTAFGIFCGANVGRDYAAFKHGALTEDPVVPAKTDAPKTPPKDEEGS